MCPHGLRRDAESPVTRALSKPLLASCLLASRWPKQVVEPRVRGGRALRVTWSKPWIQRGREMAAKRGCPASHVEEPEDWRFEAVGRGQSLKAEEGRGCPD